MMSKIVHNQPWLDGKKDTKPRAGKLRVVGREKAVAGASTSFSLSIPVTLLISISV